MSNIKNIQEELNTFTKQIIQTIDDHLRFNIEIKHNIDPSFYDKINTGMTTLHITNIMKINKKANDILIMIGKESEQNQNQNKITKILHTLTNNYTNDHILNKYKSILNEIITLCQSIFSDIKNNIDPDTKYHELKLQAYECQII